MSTGAEELGQSVPVPDQAWGFIISPNRTKEWEKAVPRGQGGSGGKSSRKTVWRGGAGGHRADTPAPHLPSGLAEVPDVLVPAGA